ncbi:MAG: peptidoglycan-associated lipoprotein Pal [Oceanospirillales bacterium]|uniref:Peptidoglycan-associated lipoprotein n=1 Tax=Marinobacterium halophilum TaxID=267374 RepID=A0A2P8EV92_9GAMM|nr:peptidoglycan-associated lipoprotein Pal [Marinobacterium halophilum]MBR9830002.1 peptidoglycan-associated lipoprotein Pal [Oceanospirillales bacterium]PSL13372.1 peptidoglycan-associated lipoprotein [Marinobacterium halophilum]
MRVSKLTKSAVIAAIMAMAAGCSTTSTTTDGGAAGVGGSAQAGNGTNSYGVSGGAVSGGAVVTAEDLKQLRTVFYFDFDRAVVRQEGFTDLEAHARYLAQNPAASVRLEGHADERGTREYNIALGERRAQSVERLLVVNGASANQVETVSYGEEKPAVLGHDATSWSQNRRVELKYLSK